MPANAEQRLRHFKSLSSNALKLKEYLKSAGSAHNLKAAGSNPAPATKNSELEDFKAERNARLLSFQILLNTWSTFDQSP
uniref:hypothetical protein n=1 Tax=Cereibacter sphaeroides TaxID=1063 RepID=UPI000F5453D7|nr:hypothetical protein [Cereibacter sphaeroides]